MANQRLTWGHVPNYPTTNDYAGSLLSPYPKYDDYQGLQHSSHFHDGNYKENDYKGSKKSDGNKPGNWDKNWHFTYILGGSGEVYSDNEEWFGRHSHVKNDCDNAKSYDNPKNNHVFWSGTTRDNGLTMSKPMGLKYKTWTAYYGTEINMSGSANGVTFNDPDRKFTRINPMGLSFSYANMHETEGGLLGDAAKIAVHALMVVLYSRKLDRCRVAQLIASPGWVMGMNEDKDNANINNMTLGKPVGRYKRYSGLGDFHYYSKPGIGASRGAPAPEVPQTRGDRYYALGSYGDVYYEFSSNVQREIVKNDWIPIGILFKWGGYMYNTVYGSAGWYCDFYNFNYIAHMEKSPIDSKHRFDRINSEPTKHNQKVPLKTIGDNKYMKL